jgi:hypothetical protein
MKSQVQTSFLNWAGCWTQLLALTPGFGPNFLGFLSLTSLLSPRLIQSRRTRLILTDQPFRTNRAWIIRFVQEQLGHQPLEAIDLELQLPASAIVIDLARIMPLSPTIVRRLGYALLATKVRDGQSFGQIAVGFA